MTLPLVTTQITIERLSTGVDPYADMTRTVIRTGAPGVISGSAGAGRDIGGAQEVLKARLITEEDVPVQKADIVTDELTGQVWRVLWARTRNELGIGHRVAELEAVEGAVS